MLKHFAFLYETDSETDEGCRVVMGATMQEARSEWVRQVTAEGMTCRLESIQQITAEAAAAFG